MYHRPLRQDASCSKICQGHSKMQQDHIHASDEHLRSLLAELDPMGPSRMAFARRAPAGIGEQSAQLLCLSASFNPLTTAHVWLIQEAGRVFSHCERPSL